MFQLIKTDFILFKKYFLLIAFYMVIFPLLLRSSWDSAASMMLVLSVYIFIFSVLGMEERDKIDLLHRTLPVKPSIIVGTKYVESVLVWVFAVLCFTLVSSLFSTYLESDAPALQQIQTVILSLCVMLLFVSISLPICYKMGFAKSRVVMVIAWVFAACLFPVIAYIAESEMILLLAGIFILCVTVTLFSWKLCTKIYKNKIA